MKSLQYKIKVAILISILFVSCQKKDEFLSQKPTSNLNIPDNLVSLQAILDSDDPVNGVMFESPDLDIVSADEYDLSFSAWQAISINPKEYNGYIWASDIYKGATKIIDWDDPYQQIFYSNVALEGLEGIAKTGNNSQQWNNVKGSAHFMRANALFNLSQVFIPPYDSNTSKTDLGLPIRLSSDINIIDKRSSVQATYDQIISDLKISVLYLPSDVTLNNPGRPSKAAAYGLLAKTFLNMHDYTDARKYADSCLKIHGTLLDYNQYPNPVTPNLTIPFSNTNAEILYQNGVSNQASILFELLLSDRFGDQGYTVDTALYSLYSSNDLRKTFFFRYNGPDQINLRPGYTANTSTFKGIATDEIYLIRAEASARTGSISDAMADLNTLLKNRYNSSTFMASTASSPEDALNQILVERRKELIFRGTRWSDLRRLNKEGYNITINRMLNGKKYTLSPNSPLYVLPIPPDEIALSGIQQNPR